MADVHLEWSIDLVSKVIYFWKCQAFHYEIELRAIIDFDVQSKPGC